MDKHIGIIGHFGGEKNTQDGQTIKTKILVEELKKYTDVTINIVDTYYKRKRPISLFIKSLFFILKEKKIVILLSGNGMRFYFPILYFASVFLHKQIYHDVIGGNLDDYIVKYPEFVKYLSGFKVNWVETHGLKNRLAEKGVTNTEVIPNFKRLTIRKTEELQKTFYKPIEFCTFSRVTKEKGIEEAILAIERVNCVMGKGTCRLDIYGLIEEDYKDTFQYLLKKYADCVAYKGVAAYSQSVDIVGAYYALLFPTYWAGEGFPGTIIDALFAGVPVIATDWKENKVIVEHGKTGIIYERCEDNLYQAIKWCIEHPEKMNVMRINCLSQAKKYIPDKYIKKIAGEMGL